MNFVTDMAYMSWMRQIWRPMEWQVRFPTTRHGCLHSLREPQEWSFVTEITLRWCSGLSETSLESDPTMRQWLAGSKDMILQGRSIMKGHRDSRNMSCINLCHARPKLCLPARNKRCRRLKRSLRLFHRQTVMAGAVTRPTLNSSI